MASHFTRVQTATALKVAQEKNIAMCVVDIPSNIRRVSYFQ